MSVVVFFEIPVSDLQRAMRFYRDVFQIELEPAQVDGNEMAYFPALEGGEGARGALAQGESYVPSLDDTRVYFAVESIEEVLERVRANGGEELYPRTSIGEYGFVAEFRDSEGNCIALSADA